jgi:phosphate:Na+ symporter
MDTFKIIYTLLGGLGIFFFGMKQMSEALQQSAGDLIPKVINSLTTNRILAVTVGMIVTMIVQSSSVTTVMVVGFVNAGLMQLTQAIGVILGSNIGTTITGWIISIKVGKYGLLLIGLGIFPVLFSKNTKLQNIGKVFFGVGMIFMGLQLMSGAFKPLRSNAEF